MDACDAITRDIVRIILERLSGVEEFDAEGERTRLRGLLEHDYAQSIYGSTAASKRSQRSSVSQLTAKRADAAAELAAKEAEYEIVLEEQRQQERIKALEEEHKKQMAAQTSELERLKVQKDVKAARASDTRHVFTMKPTGTVCKEKHVRAQTTQPETAHLKQQQPCHLMLPDLNSQSAPQ
ncbi:actin cytoskeleton-regulatory complex pan1-like protein [Labeo rohita]|uniref:Actin cytoskeleton-regulatory complex pan1-like protein n=1 Tax=Labeo rohita TaxID=84645 RepID=A0A498N865_LABRO|nr:actin cytoskeleton-regulatory complex pan1-like protein [Labeo rohita]